MNHTSDQHPWFQSARAEPRLAVPRLLRLGRREPAGEARRRRLPRPGERPTGRWDRGGRPVLPAPLLPPPARPQRRQPGGARRDRRRSSASGSEQGLVGLPRGRRPVPASSRSGCRAARSPTRTSCSRDLRALPGPAQRRGDAARRGQPAPRRTSARSSATRTATSCTCCSTSIGKQAMYLGAGARGRRRRSRRRWPRSPAIPHATPSGRLRAQPRRADARQAQRRRARRRSSTRFGPDAGHAALRPRAAPPAAADARRRRARGCGWSTSLDVLPARHAGAVLRRGDRDGREPRRSRAG